MFECLAQYAKYGAVRQLDPVDSKQNFFECEIVSKGEKSDIWIGIGPEDCHLFEMQEGMLRYQADSGNVYHGCVYHARSCEKRKIMLGLICSEGDRIGCGIDFDDDHQSDFMNVFFTRNGKQVGDLIKCRIPSFKMFPLVRLGSEGEQLHFLHHYNRPSLLSVRNIIIRNLYNYAHYYDVNVACLFFSFLIGCQKKHY